MSDGETGMGHGHAWKGFEVIWTLVKLVDVDADNGSKPRKPLRQTPWARLTGDPECTVRRKPDSQWV